MVPIFLGLAGAAADLSGNSFVNTSTAADLLSGHDSTEALDLVEFEARWEGTVYFYGWMSAMSGETGFYDLPPVDFEITFEEFFESLNFFSWDSANLGAAVSASPRTFFILTFPPMSPAPWGS
jgi:hypothetical protein